MKQVQTELFQLLKFLLFAKKDHETLHLFGTVQNLFYDAAQIIIFSVGLDTVLCLLNQQQLCLSRWVCRARFSQICLMSLVINCSLHLEIKSMVLNLITDVMVESPNAQYLLCQFPKIGQKFETYIYVRKGAFFYPSRITISSIAELDGVHTRILFLDSQSMLKIP